MASKPYGRACGERSRMATAVSCAPVVRCRYRYCGDDVSTGTTLVGEVMIPGHSCTYYCCGAVHAIESLMAKGFTAEQVYASATRFFQATRIPVVVTHVRAVHEVTTDHWRAQWGAESIRCDGDGIPCGNGLRDGDAPFQVPWLLFVEEYGVEHALSTKDV